MIRSNLVNRIFSAFVAVFPSAMLPSLLASAQAQQQKPNVVFILADNVGYGDLGPYGGGELRGAPTPRIDQLAHEGLRLTQYLVEPACTSSRAALLTGQYSIRNGLSLVIVPGTDATLSAHAYTMGDMFHGLGYATTIRDFRTYAFVVVLASRMYAFVVVRPSGNGYENNKQTCHHQGPKKG